MADRENVVSNLQILRTWCAVSCRYGGLDLGEYEKAVGWLDDALELLKVQIPIKPIRDSFLNWRCGNCRRKIYRDEGYVYCPECGRKVAWDD